jgi:hypothetical protein
MLAALVKHVLAIFDALSHVAIRMGWRPSRESIFSAPHPIKNRASREGAKIATFCRNKTFGQLRLSL